MVGARHILKQLRQRAPHIRTLLWGLHPSALPERTLVEEPVDFVVQGEGFFSFPTFIEAMRHNADPSDIAGLWMLKQGRVFAGPRPKLFKDLGRLPMPAWDLLPMQKYRAHNWHCLDDLSRRQPYAVVFTSLGCPFECSFCCVNALFGKRGIRLRPIARVLEEIQWLAEKRGVRNIKIMDEIFALDERRVEALCKAIARLDLDLNMWAYARADTLKPKMLAHMRAAGIRWVACGFESASNRVLSCAGKGHKAGRALELAKVIEEHGLNLCSNFIFGLPGDDYESMQQSLAMMCEINAPWANMYPAMAWPGSALYKQAQAMDWPLPESWEGYSPYAFDCLPIPTGRLSGGQSLAFRDYAFSVYFNSPRYLDKIRQSFGQCAMEHIQNMAAKKLPRKHAHV